MQTTTQRRHADAPESAGRKAAPARRPVSCAGIEVIDLGEAEVIVYDAYGAPDHLLDVRTRRLDELCAV